MTHFEDYLFNKLLEGVGTRKEERPPEEIMQAKESMVTTHYKAVLEDPKATGWKTSSPRDMYP